MTELTPSIEKRLRLRVTELSERIREHEGLVRALQAGEVDAVVVLQEDDTTISRLQTDEPLYRTMVDGLPQGVTTVLSDGTIVYLNRHLATLLGAPAEELLGRSLLTSLADFDRTRFAALLQRALVSPQESGFSFSWASGEAPALVSAVRLPAAGSDAVGLVIVDVRDQVARRAAEESSRAKDELLASVSHELRTPLTSIMGWIQFLELELKNESQVQPALRNLKAAVMAETKIVDDLLDLARSEKGSLPLATEDFDLCDTIRMAASFVEVQASNKHLDLKTELPGCVLPVRGDPDRLRQVFLNLLSNAVKFTPSGSVSITARKEEKTIVVDVADSGIGIIGDFLPLVFEPFRRSDRAQGYPGLGIGMAISRRIIEAHSGTIKVTSEGVGKGSTFTVRLPVA